MRLAGYAPESGEREADDTFLDTIAQAFGQVIEAKRPFTAGHSRRVGELAERIGAITGIARQRLPSLRRAALLHDIGKLGVSNMILDKPAKLTEAEWERMRGHASHTREILARIGAMADLADVAAAHHERIDGAGYPLGISGEAIPFETRIITACDFFDALTAERPYRGAMPVGEALAIIEAEVGSAVDGDCVEALRAVVVQEDGG